MGKSDNEILEARQSCVTLTNALSRLDEEKKRLVARETQKQAEIMTLKIALGKTNNDLDRLRLQLHDLEAEQSNLVSSEMIEKHLAKIQDLQDTMKARDEQMKALIQRYSLLKNAIEAAFAPLGSKIGRGNGLSLRSLLSLTPPLPPSLCRLCEHE
jgi:chromosome segregation ATPase